MPNDDMTSMTRIAFLDVAKAFAIILVVWGHLIQQTTSDFWDSKIFSFIYSFHMPLFFLLSGMFIEKLFSLSFFAALKKRFLQLLLPAFVLSFSIYLVELLSGVSSITLRNFVKVIVDMPWFCVTLFFGSMIVIVAMKWLKKDIWACLFSLLILGLIPNKDFFSLKSFLPFIWSGYFIMKYKTFIFRNAIKILPFSMLIFVILLSFWDINYTVYKTEAIFWSIDSAHGLVFNSYNIWAFVYRCSIGFWGAISALLLIKILYEKMRWIRSSVIAYIGCNTLGIYLLQVWGEKYLFKYLSVLNISFLAFSWIEQAIIFPICAVVIVLIITMLIYMLRKNGYLSLLFLGDIKVLSWKSSIPR